MGMSVSLGGFAVGGPAGMTDSKAAFDVPIPKVRLQVDQLTLRPANFEPLALENRDTCRIVAAIFQSPQAIQDDGFGGPRADIANDAAQRSD